MMEQRSPQLQARVAGFLYLIIAVAGMFAEIFVRGSIMVRGDAAATAAHILASEPLWRLGFAADLVVVVCDTAVALIFYTLLKPVNKHLSLLAAAFRLMPVPISAVNALLHLAPLLLLKGGGYLAAFAPAQLQALALFSLKLHGEGYNIALVFFGFHLVLIGYLIIRSTFLPRILGVLLAIAGLSYLINSFTGFVAPEFAARLFPYILLPAIGELAIIPWLIVRGVNAAKWREQAGAVRPA